MAAFIVGKDKNVIGYSFICVHSVASALALTFLCVVRPDLDSGCGNTDSTTLPILIKSFEQRPSFLVLSLHV